MMNQTYSVEQISSILHKVWSAETAYDSNDWSADNPARGHCVVSSLIVQDLLGGELIRFAVDYRGDKEKHYANMINGTLIDTTRSQYGDEGTFVVSQPDMRGFASMRDRILRDDDTKRRYELLKEKISIYS